MTKQQILTHKQAQAVYTAMCTMRAIGVIFSTVIPCGREPLIDVRGSTEGKVYILREHPGAKDEYEQHDSYADFAVAYGLEPGDEDAPDLDAQQAAVADVNARLAGAGLPTMRDLSCAVASGPTHVVGYTAGGQRQADFAAGWGAAQEHVFNVMCHVVLAQRANEESERSGG